MVNEKVKLHHKSKCMIIYNYFQNILVFVMIFNKSRKVGGKWKSVISVER